MFPVSVEGVLDVPADGANAALDRLNIAISAVGVRSIERQKNKLAFNGKVLWATSWNPLVCFDRCEVSIHLQKIEYNCSTKILLIWITAAVMLFWLAILSSRPNLPLVLLIVIPLFAWLWFFCGSYLFGRARMRDFLTTALETVGTPKQ